MSTLDVTRSFSGGELAPGLRARADLDLYRRGLAAGRNVIVHKVGGVSARPGTTYLGALDGVRRFIGVTFDAESSPPEAFLLELGDGTLRFWQGDELLGYTSAGAWANETDYTAGTVVTRSSVDYLCLQSHESVTAVNGPGTGSAWANVWSVVDGVYEWPAPWDADTRWEVQRQSDYRVVRFTHAAFAPRTLTYLGSGVWSLVPTVFAVIPGVAAAADDEVVDDLGISGESSGSGVAFTIAPIIREEGSSTRTIGRADDWVELDFVADDYAALFAYLANEGALSLTWTKINKPKVRGYVVWCRYTNDGGYITCVIETNKGSYTLSRNQLGVQGSVFIPGQPFSMDWRGGDTGRVERSWVPSEPTLVDAVPDDDPPFSASGDFPAAIGAHQQRLMLGGATNTPDVASGSRAASPEDFTTNTPIQDDDAVSWRQIGPQVRRILHLLEAGERLWQLSTLGAELIRGGQDGILRHGEVNPLTVSAVGAARVPQAMEVLDSPLWVRTNGQSIWTAAEGAGALDLTQLASHLFTDSTVRDWAVQVLGADDVLWVVLADGALRSLTLDRVNGVVAWTRHDSDPLADAPALFASVAVTREAGTDILYAAIGRDSVAGVAYGLERFRADDVHVDAGVTATLAVPVPTDNVTLTADTVAVLNGATSDSGDACPDGAGNSTRLEDDGDNSVLLSFGFVGAGGGQYEATSDGSFTLSGYLAPDEIETVNILLTITPFGTGTPGASTYAASLNLTTGAVTPLGGSGLTGSVTIPAHASPHAEYRVLTGTFTLTTPYAGRADATVALIAASTLGDGFLYCDLAITETLAGGIRIYEDGENDPEAFVAEGAFSGGDVGDVLRVTTSTGVLDLTIASVIDAKNITLEVEGFDDFPAGDYTDALAYTVLSDTVTGLSSLEGRAVVVLADGETIAHPLLDELGDPLVVTDGAITLPGSYTEAIVGLPIVVDIETLAVEPSGGSTNRNTAMPSGGLVAWVERSGPFYVGPRLPDSPSALSDSRVTMERPVLYDDDRNPIPAGALRTGVVKGVLRAAWGDGHIAIRHVGPEPLTIHALAPQGLGGGR